MPNEYGRWYLRLRDIASVNNDNGIKIQENSEKMKDKRSWVIERVYISNPEIASIA